MSSCHDTHTHTHTTMHVVCVCVMTRAHDDKSWSLSSLKTISAVSTSCVFRKVDQRFIWIWAWGFCLDWGQQCSCWGVVIIASNGLKMYTSRGSFRSVPILFTIFTLHVVTVRVLSQFCTCSFFCWRQIIFELSWRSIIARMKAHKPQLPGITIESYKEHKEEETLKRIKEHKQPLNGKGSIDVSICSNYCEH